MTHQEFESGLKILKVEKHDGEYRIKGYLLEFIKSPLSDHVLLKGKIPYSLAQAIYNHSEIYPDFEFQHPKQNEDNSFYKTYVTRIKISSIYALSFCIEKIREYPFINEWAIGNY